MKGLRIETIKKMTLSPSPFPALNLFVNLFSFGN